MAGALGTLSARFAAHGLGVEDLVGAHSVGRSHCSSLVAERIASVAQLMRQCLASPSLGIGNDPVVAEDAVTPNALDNQYYRNLLDQ